MNSKATKLVRTWKISKIYWLNSVTTIICYISWCFKCLLKHGNISTMTTTYAIYLAPFSSLNNTRILLKMLRVTYERKWIFSILSSCCFAGISIAINFMTRLWYIDLWFQWQIQLFDKRLISSNELFRIYITNDSR